MIETGPEWPKQLCRSASRRIRRTANQPLHTHGVDATELARKLLDPIGAHRTAGLQVDSAYAVVARGAFDWSIRRPRSAVG
jgi:hypothetical protein